MEFSTPSRKLASIYELPDAVPASSAGDTAWMLCSCALVLMMTMPGLALYYAGMVRSKNVLACVMQVFSICCLITVLWLIFGYSLSFAPVDMLNRDLTSIQFGKEFYGDGSRLWLRGMKLKTFHALAATIPESVFCMYQLTFAIITAALICGSFASRMKYTSMLLFIALWHLLVYCPMAHTNFHQFGFIKALGSLDYAGGNVVHICSGASGLATVMVIGNRKGFSKSMVNFEPSNILMTFMGMSMLWVGWMGFNAGSAVSAGFNAGYAALATQISTATASLTWMLTEWAVTGKPHVLGMISGAIAGLVSITPGSGFVDMTGAFFLGFFGGPICYGGAKLKAYLGYDDALDAFGVHAIGGIWGGIGLGFFLTDQVAVLNQATGDFEVSKDLYGQRLKGVFYAPKEIGYKQLGAQAIGVAFAFGYSFVCTAVLCLAIHYTIGLRVTEEEEEMGLDESLHGEHAIGKDEETAV